MGFNPIQSISERLALYEERIRTTRERNCSVRRVHNTTPSHPLSDYGGFYDHPGYGRIEIQHSGRELIFRRGNLLLPLQHWHYDAWVAKNAGIFFLHVPHAFDPESRLLFETNADGEIAALSVRLELSVAPIQFAKR